MPLIAPDITADRKLVVALWVSAAAGIAGGARLMWWYWPGSVFVGVTSGVWSALAWDFAHGEFYRPLLSAEGYGGTRYMPLIFVAHGLLMRAGVDPILGGAVLMQATVVAAAAALYFALRSSRTPARIAAPLAGTVWCTAVFQQYATDLRADYLAGAFAVAAIGLAARSAASAHPWWWLAGAAAASGVAGLTKVTSIAVIVPIAVWLWLTGSRRTSWQFAAGAAASWAAALAFVNLASQGRFLESFMTTATGGMTAADAWGAVPTFAREVGSDIFVAVPFVVAVWGAGAAIARRRIALPHLFVAASAFVTCDIFASPGTVANQLIELHMASALAVGAALISGDATPRAVAPVYALLGAAMAAISWPLPGLPSVIGTLRARPPHTRAAIQALHAEFLPPGTRYMANDPMIPVLANERPRLLDAFPLEQSLTRGGAVGLDFERRLRRQELDFVIIRGGDQFPADMNAGDPQFEVYRGRYWDSVRGNPVMAAMIAAAWDVHAVRKPFVILTGPPRRTP